jgi:hypothetical protein
MHLREHQQPASRRWIGQWIELLAPARPQRGAPIQKEWDVGPQLFGERPQRNSRLHLRRKGHQRGGGISRTSAQPTSHRNPFLDVDRHLAGAAGGLEHHVGGAGAEILARDLDARGDTDRCPAGGPVGDRQPVGQRDGLEDRADLMEAIGALGQHCESEIDLGVRLDAKHGS